MVLHFFANYLVVFFSSEVQHFLFAVATSFNSFCDGTAGDIALPTIGQHLLYTPLMHIVSASFDDSGSQVVIL